MPTVVVTPETVVIPTREENMRYADRVWAGAKDLARESKNMFMRALRWMGRKAREAWNWFTGKVKVGAEWLSKKASNGWERTKRVSNRTWTWFKAKAKDGWAWGRKAGRWTWDHGVEALSWAGRTTRIVIGSVLGVTWISVFGLSLLAILAIGLTIGWLVSTPMPVGELTPAEQKIINKLMNGQTLVMNEAQEKAISYAVGEIVLERDKKNAGEGMTPYEAGYFVGRVELYIKRIAGSTAKWELLYEDWEQAAIRMDTRADRAAVKAGMRAADREVKKLLVLHSSIQVQEPVVV